MEDKPLPFDRTKILFTLKRVTSFLSDNLNTLTVKLPKNWVHDLRKVVIQILFLKHFSVFGSECLQNERKCSDLFISEGWEVTSDSEIYVLYPRNKPGQVFKFCLPVISG